MSPYPAVGWPWSGLWWQELGSSFCAGLSWHLAVSVCEWMTLSVDAYTEGCCAWDGTFDNLKLFVCMWVSGWVPTERDMCRARVYSRFIAHHLMLIQGCVLPQWLHHNIFRKKCFKWNDGMNCWKVAYYGKVAYGDLNRSLTGIPGQYKNGSANVQWD